MHRLYVLPSSTFFSTTTIPHSYLFITTTHQHLRNKSSRAFKFRGSAAPSVLERGAYFKTRTMQLLVDAIRKDAEANGGKIQGPLARITDALGLDFLDEEWKRVVFLGLLTAVVAFFIALFGNLTQKDELEKLEAEERERSRINEEEEQRPGTEADDDDLQSQQQQQQTKQDAKQLLDATPSKDKAKNVVEGAVVDAVLDKKIEDAVEDKLRESTESEDAKEQTIIQSLASWRLFNVPQTQFDGGAEAFRSMIDKLKPNWWTNELANNLSVVSHLYSRLVMGVMETHQFRYPLPLNILLAGLLFWDFKHQVIETGVIGNTTLAKAHYYLQFADASYSSDLRSAGILRRSVVKAALGPRNADINCLRHVLFVDHLTRSVVLMIRGTADLEDMLVDLLANEVDFMGGVAHSGLLEEARSVLAEVGPLIEPTLRMYGYQTLVLTGHSLGAGTAVLASIVLRNEHANLKDVTIQCYVYGCPPVIGPPERFPADDPRLAGVEINSFVYNADVIPRTSLFALELGMRLWIALDMIENFGVVDRLRCLMNGKVPADIADKVTELVKQSESKSNYQKMIVPGKIVWLVRNPDTLTSTQTTNAEVTGGANKTIPEASEEKSELLVSCPSDPLSISAQPMFVGSSWLLDHRLTEYKRSLETV